MGFTGKLLKSLTRFFLVLHWVALLYAVVAPILLWVPVIYYAVGAFYVPPALAPVEPLSLELLDLLGLAIPPHLTGSHPLLALGVLMGIVLLKLLIYSALGKNRVHGVPVAWIPAAYTVIALLVVASILLSSTSLMSLKWILALLLAAPVYTVPMDLVVFSYVKFRNAVKRDEPRMWIPVLVALWTAIPWLTLAIIIAIYQVPETSWISLIASIPVSMRIAITALQLLYIALYIHSGGTAILEAGKNTHTTQTTTPSS